MTIYSPVDGIVMEKMVFKGQNVMAGMDLYKIADLSTLWVLADIYQYELPWVKVGQRADVELSYLAGKTFQGTVTYIYPTVNMETKTAKARVVVRNTASLDLKPEMFATVKITSPVVVDAVAIPNQAIIRSGERNIAVIALGGGYFDPREIRLGVMADGFVQVLDGIKEGEKIVTSSQFLIDSESNLKAAVGLMQGHEGHDMSPPATVDSSGRAGKPMEQGTMEKKQSPTSAETKKQGRETAKEAPPRQTGEAAKAEKRQMQDHDGQEMKAALPETVVDPVCGMTITPDPKRSFSYKGKTYYFCMDDDLEKFKENPEKYLKGDQEHE